MTRLNRATRLLLTAAAAALLLLAAAAWLALEGAPSTPKSPLPAVADVMRANALLMQHDPRRALPGITRAAALSQRDVELLLAQGARHFGSTPRAQFRLNNGQAELRTSLPLRLGDWTSWVNLAVQLRQTDTLPSIEGLRVGALPLPATLVGWALPNLLRGLGLAPQAELALQMVNRVTFRPGLLVVAFAWPENAEQRLADSLMPPAEQARMRVYVERLAVLTRELKQEFGKQQVPLPRLLQPMFELAAQQSARSHQPAKENRAVLLLLTSLVNRQELKTLGPVARLWPRLEPITVSLAGRTDTPKHYLVSATLAIQGGGPLSDAVGLYKEVSDSRGGSGFSFNDLAADRAGTRFGQMATGSPESMQARLAAGVQEHDLLPPVADLPEDMQAPEFQQRFGGIGAPAYRAMMDDIETRLDRLPLLAQLPRSLAAR